jgi:hypothetical protein
MEQGTLSRREGHMLAPGTHAVLAAVAFAGACGVPSPTVRRLALGLSLLSGLIMVKTQAPHAPAAWMPSPGSEGECCA